jgi:hypothetical protein
MMDRPLRDGSTVFASGDVGRPMRLDRHGGAIMRLLDNAEWVQDNFGGCQLGNRLRNKRLAIVATNMLEAPESSLCQQNQEWSDTKAAYELWKLDEVTFDSVADCHWKQTRQTPPGRYLLISDTTDLDHYTHEATEGLGMLGDGKGRGMQLHSCLFVNSSEQVIGTGGALLFYRKRVPKNETRKQRLSRSRESELWGNLVDKVGPPPEGSQWIHVFDRGGDNYEALCHIQRNRCDWVIRAAKLDRKVINAQGVKVPLSDAIEQAEESGSYELNLRSRQGVPARTAKIKVSVTRVTLPRPQVSSRYVKDSGITSIETNVVIVQEVDAPKGVKPIQWVLFTSLPVSTFEEVWQVIEAYETRWTIEEYHKVLKTGCSIERHSLRTRERLEALTGLITVVGVRLLQLKTISQKEPEAKAKNRVPSMWLNALKGLKPKITITTLTVHEFFRELAKLGGFLARKHDGEPGWQTIWRGYKKLHLIVEGMKLAIT